MKFEMGRTNFLVLPESREETIINIMISSGKTMALGTFLHSVLMLFDKRCLESHAYCLLL